VLKGAEVVQGTQGRIQAPQLDRVAGESFTVTATEQIAGRLDTAAVKQYHWSCGSTSSR
jgi:hypothetical protein